MFDGGCGDERICVGANVACNVSVGVEANVLVVNRIADGVRLGKSLCDYNDETTPPNNLEYKAEEKMRWLQSKSG